jgi:methyl-accepting chemotaxis protein
MLKFGIGGKLLVLSAVMFVGFALLAGLASWKIYESIGTERTDKVRSLSESAGSIVKAAYPARAHDGRAEGAGGG